MAARHDEGDAKIARDYHGAIVDLPMGLMGNSYAIATRDEKGKKIPFKTMRTDAWFFINCAMSYPHLTFNMTEIGAKEFGSEVMRNLFTRVPRNVNLPDTWVKIWDDIELEWLSKQGLKE